MANSYDTLRGRSKFQTAGVSDITVRLKDMVIGKSLPEMTPLSADTPMSYCFVISSVEGVMYQGKQTGSLRWRSNSNYGQIKPTDSFRDRYSNNFILDKFQLSGY